VVLGLASIVIGVCFNVPVLTTAGLIAVGVGLLLMILWTLLCARFTPCSVMQTIQCILFVLVAVIGPIIAVLAAVFGGGILSACFGAAVGAWAGWGTLYAWLHKVMQQVGCHELC